MSLIIMLAFLGSNPEFFASDSLGVVTKLLISSQSGDDLEQVDSRVVPRCLCSGVRQESLIVELLHMLHGLLWRDPELT